VRADTALIGNALLLQQRAVTELQGAAQVRVVGPDNKVSLRNVKLGARSGNRWVVESGIVAGASVIVEGPQLRDGAAGTPGVRGECGPPGERGERGLMGALPRVKAWEPGVHYTGDVVADGGATYQALHDTAEQPTRSKHWVCLARAGADGEDGRSMDVRGLFSDKEVYRALDIVALNGSSFVAKKDDPGPCPGAGWQLLVSQGKAGPKGERGERGLQGPSGVPVFIAGWQIDRNNYTAVPVMSDGREGPPLELRSLFDQFHMETR
jgi:hypothetical protein